MSVGAARGGLGVRATGQHELRGLGDLDECNGRTGQVTVRGVTSVTYHYFITHAFPYIPRCWKATPDPSFEPRVSPPGG